MMNSLEPKSTPLPRREIVAFIIIAAAASSSLIYGMIAARPPISFVLISAAIGCLYVQILLWGRRRSRYPLVAGIGWGLFMFSFDALRRVFFGHSPDPFWPIFAVQFGAFLLGTVPFYPAISRTAKATQYESDRNG